MDNPVFTSSLLWIGMFVFCGSITLYYKYEEVASAERQKKQILDELSTAAATETTSSAVKA